jgi:DNA-binding CsgD family transcriptional regulator
MRLLGPHIQRAVLIAKIFDFKDTESAMFSEMLDGLRAAIFFVDANGHLIHANAAGHNLIADGSLVQVTAGKLAAREPQVDAGLQETFLAASKGDGAIGGIGIALPLIGKTGERHVAHVLPLTSGARKVRTNHAASAAVFVHKSAVEAPSPPEVIAKAYKLTMTELRVLLAIIDIGGGVPEVAEVLGIAATTVRTHLRNVFSKTGASRQADLVKLVAGYCNPLVK